MPRQFYFRQLSRQYWCNSKLQGSGGSTSFGPRLSTP